MDLRTLYRLGIFVNVVDQGSFTAAGEKLGLSKSVVSQHVSDLETQLGVPLLNRTTRSVSTTEEGDIVGHGARAMLDDIEAVLDTLESRRDTASGLIRLTSSHNFASSYLSGCLARFSERHPFISIELTINDAILNMVEEGFDIAFRIGQLDDSSLRAVKICRFEMILCAASDYLARHEPVREPRDVRAHAFVAITILPDVRRLQLSASNGQTSNLAIEPKFCTNSGFTAKQLIGMGAGIGLLPDYAIVEELASGRLVRLLPAWRHRRRGDISALYVPGKQMSPRVRRFLDFMKTDVVEYLPRSQDSRRR